MAGSFAEACAIIASVNPGGITAMGTGIRTLGQRSQQAGDTLAGSAEQVGAQYGAPYAAYETRLAPVAGWLRNLQPPATTTADALDNAATVSRQAQWVMAQQQTMLARAGLSTAGMDATAAASRMAQAEAAALAVLNAEITKMTGAFAAVQPPDPGTAPVHGGSGGTGTGTDPSLTGPGATAIAAGTGGAGGQAGAGTPTGPQSGQYAGWVQDPTTGNLVDPATGREVDPSGRFVDPVTGQPFGDPSQYASRLEGLQGGIGALGGGAGGVGVGPALSTPGLGAGGGVSGAAFAPYYGGMIPPSLVGGNPAGAQLRHRAAENLAARAETAQRFTAIAAGDAPTATGPAPAAGAAAPATGYGYVPPMGGGMAPMGMGAGGRSTTRPGKRMVSEPASVWGATGRGTRGTAREKSEQRTEVVEDADVWTGGATEVGPGVLGGR